MLSKNKWSQYGLEREGQIKCIVIHNTGYKYNSARDFFNYLELKDKSSSGCHYLIDHKEIIEVMPLDWSVYHTGKGIDYACKFGIAIEIVSNNDNELYLQGQKKAIELIKKLMKKYNLTTKDIYFHSDFDVVHCPTNILNMYGNKKNFIRKELE